MLKKIRPCHWLSELWPHLFEGTGRPRTGRCMGLACVKELVAELRSLLGQCTAALCEHLWVELCRRGEPLSSRKRLSALENQCFLKSKQFARRWLPFGTPWVRHVCLRKYGLFCPFPSGACHWLRCSPE